VGHIVGRGTLGWSREECDKETWNGKMEEPPGEWVL